MNTKGVGIVCGLGVLVELGWLGWFGWLGRYRLERKWFVVHG